MTSHIAVVGLDCRFPKAADPDALWRLLLDGADGVEDVPADRWAPESLLDDGTINHRRGGYVADADAFDNDFFGIAPREAAAMDPQQRLLLQSCWRALEDATLDPRRQAGSNTGVFVGVMANEWAHLHARDPRQVTAQFGSGNGYFMTANRLSYQFDLRGPSLAVDTACSSSLTAVHLACQALRNGECDQALAAGVNLALTPALDVYYTKAGLAAPDGRCKPFSAAADGIGRGEGVAVVVLCRLADAVDADLPIYAVIEGSAVNSDGRSNGVTAPNRWAQRHAAETAYRAAGVTPDQIDFLEAHGTGTLLGDMIEAKALADVHRVRRERPCAIGSIKGNLGHTEGAAGIAGLIKTVLSLHHRLVPASRFADEENPRLRLAEGGLRMLTEPMALAARSVHAGVSSFGLGGTNCHVVLATAPQRDVPPSAPADGGQGILTLSSNSPDGLRRNAALLAEDLATGASTVAAIARATNRIKSSGRTRLAIVARDRAEAVTALRGDFEIGTCTGLSLGWLFTGQGTQFPGMGTVLDDPSGIVERRFSEVDAALRDHLGVSIRDAMSDERIHRTEFAQPAIFAVQYAQAHALLDIGARPAWLLGHSVGEYAAATVAGVMTLSEASLLVAARGRLMQELPDGGGMLAVEADADDLPDIGLDVAAVNGPEELVLSGPRSEIGHAARRLRASGISVRELTVSHAFHSRLMAPMIAEFAAIARGCDFRPPSVPVYSTVHGRLVGDDEPMDADYWCAHVGATVRFADAAALALTTEPTHTVEFGPKRALGPIIGRSHPHPPVALSPSAGFSDTVAALYRDGLDPEWNRLHGSAVRSPERISGYSFSTANRYWFDRPAPDAPAPGTAADVTDVTTESNTAPSAVNGSTVDTLIALFREQAAVLAKAVDQPRDVAADTPPAAETDAASVVFAEVSRISGFPVQRLRLTHSVIGDLGFDSIMVTDLFKGLSRRIPVLVIDASWFGPATTVGDLVAACGGPASVAAASASPPRPTTSSVAAQYAIAEFDEVKAFADRRMLIDDLGIDNPYFVVNDGVTADTSVIDGVDVVNFSSFNYLGMSGHPAVAASVSDAVVRYGSSCSASRLLSGEKPVHRELESALAELIGTEDALTFVNGHATNVTVIGHLLGEGDLIVHDGLAHDSIVQGCKLSGAFRRSFPHNDAAALDDILTATRHRFRRVLIVVEGVYSQDGDIADLPAFIAVKKKHRALLMIDEAHSIGALGLHGGGIGEHFGVNRDDVELWSGTLSKALAGCGGYVAGSRVLIEYLKYTTPGFIFSGGMAPPIAAAALAAIRLLRTEPEPLRRLRENSELFLSLAKQAGLDTGLSGGTPVVPCIVGSSARALLLSNALMRRGINANPILYPAVPEDQARLRFFITSCHSEEQLRGTIDALREELAVLPAG